VGFGAAVIVEVKERHPRVRSAPATVDRPAVHQFETSLGE
jgi:hypothetical protein